MFDENKLKTKVCKQCERELPLSNFNMIYGKSRTLICKECIAENRMKKCYENGLALYKSDDSMKTKRTYKKPYSSQILRKSVSGIDYIARDEKFVRLLDYKDTWISNYGRAVVKNGDSYKLLSGSYSKESGEKIFTLEKNVYFKTTKKWGYKKQKVTASSLVIQAFIVNYDMQNNTCCWHKNGDKRDNYYKNLYPVNELQYLKIQSFYEKNGSVSEDEIMDIINAVEYKSDNWNPWYFRRTYEGIGYIGTNDVDYNSEVFIKWRDMIQRCYNRIVHRLKPYYKGIKVCEEWHNFQNFKIWYEQHKVPDAKVDLDKDLLCKNSNTYSPETCALLTHYLNTMFEDRGIKSVISESGGKFKVSMSILNKTKDVGMFDSKEEANKAFSDYKKKYIAEVAENCKDKVPDCVYQAMMGWKIGIGD